MDITEKYKERTIKEELVGGFGENNAINEATETNDDLELNIIEERIKSDYISYCLPVILEITRAFDKMCHEGLYYKLKKHHPHPHYQLIKSYSSDKRYYVKTKSLLTGIP